MKWKSGFIPFKMLCSTSLCAGMLFVSDGVLFAQSKEDPKTEVVVKKYGNYADTFASDREFQEMAISWVEKGKAMVPEEEKEEFEKAAWDVIKDKNERTRIGVGAIAKKYNHIEREDALAIVGNGFYKDVKKIIEEKEKAIVELTNANVELTNANNELDTALEEQKEIIDMLKIANNELKIANNELKIANNELKIKLNQKCQWLEDIILWLKNKGVKRVKQYVFPSVENSVLTLKQQGYRFDYQTIQFLLELGISTDWLNIKNEDMQALK